MKDDPKKQLHLHPFEAAIARDAIRRQKADHERAELQDAVDRALLRELEEWQPTSSVRHSIAYALSRKSNIQMLDDGFIGQVLVLNLNLPFDAPVEPFCDPLLLLQFVQVFIHVERFRLLAVDCGRAKTPISNLSSGG